MLLQLCKKFERRGSPIPFVAVIPLLKVNNRRLRQGVFEVDTLQRRWGLLEIATKKQPGVFVVSSDWFPSIDLKAGMLPGLHVVDSLLVDQLFSEKSFKDFVS